MDQPDELVRENGALPERLSRLGEATLSINESLDFETVLQRVLDSARSLTGARYGAITLSDDLVSVGARIRSRSNRCFQEDGYVQNREVTAHAYPVCHREEAATWRSRCLSDALSCAEIAALRSQ